MVRTQIQLTEEQHRKLRRLARAEGVSLAELVRRCVDASLGDVEPARTRLYERAAQLVGRFEDSESSSDLSGEHDRYFADSVRE